MKRPKVFGTISSCDFCQFTPASTVIYMGKNKMTHRCWICHHLEDLELRGVDKKVINKIEKLLRDIKYDD